MIHTAFNVNETPIRFTIAPAEVDLPRGVRAVLVLQARLRVMDARKTIRPVKLLRG